MTTWLYNEQGHDEPLEITDEEILTSHFDHWCNKMNELGRAENISMWERRKMCIDDFVVVHWAWRKYPLYKFVFRGNVVFSYDPETREMTADSSDANGIHFNYCKFIDEDAKLLSRYFQTIYEHRTGVLHHSFLKSIEVN